MFIKSRGLILAFEFRLCRFENNSITTLLLLGQRGSRGAPNKSSLSSSRALDLLALRLESPVVYENRAGRQNQINNKRELNWTGMNWLRFSCVCMIMMLKKEKSIRISPSFGSYQNCTACTVGIAGESCGLRRSWCLWGSWFPTKARRALVIQGFINFHSLISSPPWVMRRCFA